MKYLSILTVLLMIVPSAQANWSKDHKGMKHGKVKTSTLEFEEGRYTLTNPQKESIKKMVDSLRRNGESMTLGIAAWSDQPFPANQQDLSSQEQKLAQRRAQSVSDYIAKIDFKGSTDTYNMAERSNWLAKIFNTESSEMKSMFSKKDESSNLLREKYQAYKDNGGPGKVVLVVSKD